MSAEQAFVTTPEVSVVIPAFERATALAACLDALALQTLPRTRFEVIVCDDGSRVPIARTLEHKLRLLSDRLCVRVIRQGNAGPAAARNRGAVAARGRYLAFTDDDCRPQPDWLEQLLQRFAQSPHALIGGGMRTSATSDRFAHATQAIMDFVYAEQERRGGMRLFSTSNLALPAGKFRELGGFSALFTRAAGEDYDLCARYYDLGGDVIYHPAALVVHDHALTLRSYWLQHVSYGRGLLTMRQRLRLRGSSMRPGTIPGSFHLRLMLSPIAAHGLRGVAASLLITLSQIATGAGVVAQLIRPHRTQRPSVELAPAREPT